MGVKVSVRVGDGVRLGMGVIVEVGVCVLVGVLDGMLVALDGAVKLGVGLGTVESVQDVSTSIDNPVEIHSLT